MKRTLVLVTLAVALTVASARAQNHPDKEGKTQGKPAAAETLEQFS
ncbi:MAG: hypothetical protein OEX18_10940 [Candidatus Krumholzibacteria bacterium]|nr:hypothetical protein [Candidatus Krumholzibacteria bacterium]MDH4337775.1 hypothetical protein [Candidatus Krumholzibacteria bacterium]MDH5271400.1 hypothetical protein [Candidatus Krumholzibacteria bacterium]